MNRTINKDRLTKDQQKVEAGKAYSFEFNGKRSGIYCNMDCSMHTDHGRVLIENCKNIEAL